jgi:hypothetical protein
MVIRIMYTDYRYDYVSARMLDQLIASRCITKFLRPSENAWIDIVRHLIRGTEEVTYIGPERRVSHQMPLE